MVLPTPEDLSSLSKWMDERQIQYVQAPFEADAQMKQVIEEGGASTAITEDGDLVVFETPHILCKAKIDTKHPTKKHLPILAARQFEKWQVQFSHGPGAALRLFC